jgi:hypothetical protein
LSIYRVFVCLILLNTIYPSVITIQSMLQEQFKGTKRKSEALNERTGNTMARRKRTKGQETIYITLHRKLKIEHHEPTKHRGRTQVLRKGNQFLFHMWRPSCFSCYNRVKGQDRFDTIRWYMLFDTIRWYMLSHNYTNITL